MKKIGIRILGCMALLSMVGCGRIEGASVQDLSNTKDAIVESETTLAENNNEYSNKNSLFYSDISSYEIFTDVNSEAALKNLYYNIDDFIDSDSSDVIVKGNIIEIEYVYIDGCSYSVLTVDVERAYKGEGQASAGGIQIDTMFVDEGFGSLDTEKTLPQAYKALVSVTEGRKLVGIISHVTELKEKIDKQIVVEKDRTGRAKARLVV